MAAPRIDRRPIRVGAFSGYAGDRYDGLLRQATHGNVDILFGDYLAEVNIARLALDRSQDPTKGYEMRFFRQFCDAVDVIVEKRLRVVTNAGGLNPSALAEACDKLLKSRGYQEMKVAAVTGDDVLPFISSLTTDGEHFPHLEDQRPLASWGLKPISANAYCGARAIVGALDAGADIIITGRVTDASPVIAASQWWHGWSWNAYDRLAGALLAGHCIECGPYCTGGNFSGFKSLGAERCIDLAFPIAEVSADGTFIITRPEQGNFNGVVTIDTVRSQMLYELQGNIYLNPDVQGILNDVQVQEVGRDRVRVFNVKGAAPPDTTKVAICAVGGHQAEQWVCATGLDIKEKFANVELHVKAHLGEKINEFNVFDFTQYGVPQEDPSTEALGTAMLRIFAQAPKLEAFSHFDNMLQLAFVEGLGHFPGMHFNLDTRICLPKPYIEYWPALMNIKYLTNQYQFVGAESAVAVTGPSQITAPLRQSNYDSTGKELDSSVVLETVRGPLGWIVHARSGDKGGNVNVGFYVRHEDEYPWLRSLLSHKKMVELLSKEFVGNKIERVEFPGIWAVHFVVHDYLGNGVSSTSRMDALGKSLAEFLRAKYVNLPKKFLARGRI
ncbi:DUF1446-domain-containing protein [Hymenopellis radicata]|nr:DUF1446-domain-containing protein [Hymenopellis radicata]